MPSTKNWSECFAQLPPELKIEISLNDISLATADQYIILCARFQVSDPGP